MKYYLFVILLWSIGGGVGYNLNFEINSSFKLDSVPLDYSNSDIFINNLKLCCFNLLGGIFFGVYSVISLFYNSVLNGMLVREIGNIDISLFSYLKYAIFENLGILMSCKLGIELGRYGFLYTFFDKSPQNLRGKRFLIEVVLMVLFIFLGAILEV